MSIFHCVQNLNTLIKTCFTLCTFLLLLLIKKITLELNKHETLVLKIQAYIIFSIKFKSLRQWRILFSFCLEMRFEHFPYAVFVREFSLTCSYHCPSSQCPGPPYNPQPAAISLYSLPSPRDGVLTRTTIIYHQHNPGFIVIAELVENVPFPDLIDCCSWQVCFGSLSFTSRSVDAVIVYMGLHSCRYYVQMHLELIKKLSNKTLGLQST